MSSIVENIVDSSIYVATESVKTVVREALLLGFQTLNVSSKIFLHFADDDKSNIASATTPYDGYDTPFSATTMTPVTPLEFKNADAFFSHSEQSLSGNTSHLIPGATLDSDDPTTVTVVRERKPRSNNDGRKRQLSATHTEALKQALDEIDVPQDKKSAKMRFNINRSRSNSMKAPAHASSNELYAMRRRSPRFSAVVESTLSKSMSFHGITSKQRKKRNLSPLQTESSNDSESDSKDQQSERRRAVSRRYRNRRAQLNERIASQFLAASDSNTTNDTFGGFSRNRSLSVDDITALQSTQPRSPSHLATSSENDAGDTLSSNEHDTESHQANSSDDVWITRRLYNRVKSSFGMVRDLFMLTFNFYVWLIMMMVRLPAVLWRHIIYGSEPRTHSSIFSLTHPRAAYNKVYQHEKLSTGLVEDLHITFVQFVDSIAGAIRAILLERELRRGLEKLRDSFLLWKPSNFLSETGLDMRTVEDIIRFEGYPVETYTTVTDDGYVLTMQRIPNKTSTQAIYFQHGILDSAFAWVANGSTHSLALRAHTSGYDVFLGNFRGSGSSALNHSNPNISQREYWNYSINELAFYDMKAFVQKINEIKTMELQQQQPKQQQQQQDEQKKTEESSKPPFTLTAIAHSMGGGTVLAYVVYSRIMKQPHHLSRLLLLSPAGSHQTLPTVLVAASHLLFLTKFIPLYHLGLSSHIVRVLVAKIFQDINNQPAVKALVLFFVNQFILGGERQSSPFNYVHNLSYNTFYGTSINVIRHFLQMRSSGKFEAFNHGPKENTRRYGTPEPINFFDHYDTVDIPVHIMLGEQDRIIPEECILTHYNTLKKLSPRPDLISLRRFSRVGHIDLTMGSNERIILHVLDVLRNGAAAWT